MVWVSVLVLIEGEITPLRIAYCIIFVVHIISALAFRIALHLTFAITFEITLEIAVTAAVVVSAFLSRTSPPPSATYANLVCI